MAYIHFSEQEKQTANNTDIALFLQTQGETVKRAGREQVWEAPSGKVSINGSQWYSQYEQTGGGAILFVRKFFGMSFPEAVSKLLGGSAPMALIQSQQEQQKKEKKPFEPPQKNSDMRRVYGYLMNERYIDRDIIHAFAHADLLYEDAEHHNAVFVGKDKDGVIRHIHKRSTVPSSSFKNNIDSSIAEYSFHWIGSNNRLYVFEAPIDMLAYISMHKNNWQMHSYVALCSTADRAMMQMLKDYPNIDSVHLCLDHDSPGIEGAYRLAESIRTLDKEYLIWRVFSKYKDWDEDLKAMHGKDAIPASEHHKMSLFYDNTGKAVTELSSMIPKINSKDVAQRFKGESLINLIRGYLYRADTRTTENEKIQQMRDAGKTAIVGYMVGCKNQSLEEIKTIIEKKYRPHHDYDSVEGLAKGIHAQLTEIESRINSKYAFTDEEWSSLHENILGVAVDCFRQCGNIQTESEAFAIKNGMVYN